MGIDYGTKRVGIAVTDPLQIFASGLQTVATHKLLDFLGDYFSRENVTEIVIGYPKKMNNQPSDTVKHIDPFIRRLKQLYPEKKIILADERLTSKIAFRSMIDAGLKRKQRQNVKKK